MARTRAGEPRQPHGCPNGRSAHARLSKSSTEPHTPSQLLAPRSFASRNECPGCLAHLHGLARCPATRRWRICFYAVSEGTLTLSGTRLLTDPPRHQSRAGRSRLSCCCNGGVCGSRTFSQPHASWPELETLQRKATCFCAIWASSFSVRLAMRKGNLGCQLAPGSTCATPCSCRRLSDERTRPATHQGIAAAAAARAQGLACKSSKLSSRHWAATALLFRRKSDIVPRRAPGHPLLSTRLGPRRPC
jgi:hypothetical protein